MANTRTIALLFGLAVTLAGCGHKDQPTSTGSGSPTTPTSPTAPTTPPETPTPPTPQTCAYAVAAEPDDFDRDGGNGKLTITTTAGCKWTIKSDASWVAIEGPLQGEGAATVKFSTASNDDASDRRMTLAVADKSAAISQRGQGDCTFQISPVTSTIPRSPWTSDINVTTGRGCRWTAASDTPWVRLRGTGGSGSGTLTYEADFNPETRYAVTRTAVIGIRWTTPTAGQNVRVTQWGDCNIALGVPGGSGYASDTLNVGAAGGTFHYFVLTDPFMGCAWTVESNDSWVSVTSPRLHQVSGGDGDLHFTIPANTSVSRRAVITIGDKPLTIIQQGR